MGTLVILFLLFGKITWPIFYAVISIVWHLISSPFRTMASEKSEKMEKKKPEKKRRGEDPNLGDPPEETPKELPHEQKVMACSNIIEDAYSYKDEFLDELYEGNEQPIFSVLDCLKCSLNEYQDQFGKRWEAAWTEALTLCFGIPFESLGEGCFLGSNAK